MCWLEKEKTLSKWKANSKNGVMHNKRIPMNNQYTQALRYKEVN